MRNYPQWNAAYGSIRSISRVLWGRLLGVCRLSQTSRYLKIKTDMEAETWRTSFHTIFLSLHITVENSFFFFIHWIKHNIFFSRSLKLNQAKPRCQVKLICTAFFCKKTNQNHKDILHWPIMKHEINIMFCQNPSSKSSITKEKVMAPLPIDLF